MTEKSKSEQLKESLFYKRKNGRLVSSEEVLKKADEYCEGYKSFLNAAKTEREAVKVPSLFTAKNITRVTRFTLITAARR